MPELVYAPVHLVFVMHLTGANCQTVLSTERVWRH